MSLRETTIAEHGPVERGQYLWLLHEYRAWIAYAKSLEALLAGAQHKPVKRPEEPDAQ